jgi:flagellin-like hook-associated protein FlgL
LLKSPITGTTKAITNTPRANSLVGIADSALGQISNLLNDIKGLVVEAANTGTMTADQIKANQLQVDAALDSIDRIARQTNYTGKKLLDGSLDFRTAGQSGGVSNIHVNSAQFGTGSAVGVNVNVQQAADYARLVSNGTGLGVDTTFDVIGSRGSTTISMAANSTNAEIADAINRSTDSTGVIAYVEGQAERGSVILSSAGKNNDILITSLQKGLDAGNYEFRITEGHTNDVRVVQEAKDGKPGIVEISLVAAQEAQYKNFAGMFDVSIDTSARGADAATSLNITTGASNKVVYTTSDAAASTNSITGRSMTADVAMGAGGETKNSALNGWSVVVNNTIVSAAGNEVVDLGSKTVYLNSSSDGTQLNAVLSNALADTMGGDALTTPAVNVSLNGFGTTGFVNGDRFTFSDGASAGEVFITYKEGATVDEILGLLNNAPNVQAALSPGVDGSTLVKNLIDGQTSVSSHTTAQSRYTSAATSQQVIDLINSKLGDMFNATGLGDDGTGGRISFMDAAVDYGDINLGNAIRFSGMDNGPIIRMTTLGSNGQPVAEQKLSVSIIHPNEADIKAGIHTPVLEIKLATDKQGNSITTAQDIVNLFNKLTAEQTMGVSVSQLYPPGVDPNGRVSIEDACGNTYELKTCPTPINGIVQPTGAPGACGPQQGDLILLGGNQRIVTDNAVARISGNNRPTAPTGSVSSTAAANPAGVTTLTNGVGGTQLASGGTAPSTLSFSAETARLLEGLNIRIQTSAAGDASNPAWFDTGTGELVINTQGVDVAAAEIEAAIVSVLNGSVAGTPGQPNVLAALNEHRAANGLRELSAADIGIAGDGSDGVGGGISGTMDTVTSLVDGDHFTIAPAAPVYGPTVTFSAADAIGMSGVTFAFVDAGGSGGDHAWDAASKTLSIDVNSAVPADDAELLVLVNAAIAAQWGGAGGIAATLGLDSTAPAVEALAAIGSANLVAGDPDDVGTADFAGSSSKMPFSVDTSKAITGAVGGASSAAVQGQTLLTFENTSAMNGVTFGFTRDEKKEGFDANTGTLLVFVGSEFDALTPADKDGAKGAAMLRTAVDSAVAANWESIRAFTRATGDTVKLAKDQDASFTVTNALVDASNADAQFAYAADGKTMISSSYAEGPATGTRGTAPSDPVLLISAVDKGTEMAGISIHFVNDTNSGLAQWNSAYEADYTNTSALPEVKVDFIKKEDGSRELIITANLGTAAASEMNAGLLARALAANSTFSSLFKAEATQFASSATAAAGDGAAGSVLFNTDISKPAGQTVGGYKIESVPSGSNKTATSSGIGMTGQSDANERLIIESEELGSKNMVAINVIEGVLNTVDEYGYQSNYASGLDMVASVNGIRAVTDGNNVSIDTTNLSVSMNVANAAGGYGFTITGGGALFQLGPDVVSNQQVRIGLTSMLTTALGGSDGSLYMLRTGNVAALGSDDNGRKLADRIVTQAIQSVANTRGRLGAIQRGTLEPTVAALQDSMVALTEANAMITNADFAVESSNLTRLQLLVQAGAQTLGIANQLPQYAASLIR